VPSIIGQTKVHLFELLGADINKNQLSNLIKSYPKREAVYIYTDKDLFELAGSVNFPSTNSILYIDIRGKYVPYDPLITYYSNKDLYIKTKDNEYYLLNLRTPRKNMGLTVTYNSVKLTYIKKTGNHYRGSFGAKMGQFLFNR